MPNGNSLQPNQRTTVVIHGNVGAMFNSINTDARDNRPDFTIEMPRDGYEKIMRFPESVRINALKNIAIHGFIASTSFFVAGMVTTYLDIQLVGSGAKENLIGIAIGSATYGLALQAAELLKDKIAFRATDKFWDSLKELYTGKKELSFEERMMEKFEIMAKLSQQKQSSFEERMMEKFETRERKFQSQEKVTISRACLTQSEEELITPLLETQHSVYSDYGSMKEEYGDENNQIENFNLREVLINN